MRRSIAASIAARIVAAGIGLVALPLYIRFLGLEAYGLVGFFTSIQTLLVFMDLGLAATLTKEVAAMGAGSAHRTGTRDLVWTFELAYLALAIIIGLLLALAAPEVAARWLKPEMLTSAQISRGAVLAAFALTAQWPINLYSAAMAGLQRQFSLAIVSSGFSILRVVLTLAVLSWQADMEAFFSCQIFVSLLQSAVMHLQVWHHMRQPHHTRSFNFTLLMEHHRFAGGMTIITISGVILTQMDKVILSRALPLAEFGVYMMCATIASGLYILISPLFSVMYPRFAQLLQQSSESETNGFFIASSQVMSVLTIPLAVVLSVFSELALFILTGNRLLSTQGEWVLRLLVIGTAANGLMNVPYALQLAAGWTRLSVYINAVAVLVLAPLTWWLAQFWGAAGGAMAWCVLNVVLVLVTPQFVHRRLVTGIKREWYISAILQPLVASIVVAAIVNWLQPGFEHSRFLSSLYLAACWAIMAVVTAALLPHIRGHLLCMIPIGVRKIISKSAQ